MTDSRNPKRRLRRLMIFSSLVGATFGYRHYRLSKAPQPSWDNPA